MVRHALHDVIPTLSATQTITANSKMYFFILFRFLIDKFDDLVSTEGAHKDATLAVFRLRAAMKSDTAPPGYVTDKRQVPLKAR